MVVTITEAAIAVSHDALAENLNSSSTAVKQTSEMRMANRIDNMVAGCDIVFSLFAGFQNECCFFYAHLALFDGVEDFFSGEGLFRAGGA